MSHAIEYLLFDVDGTLLDFTHSEQKALTGTFQEFGYSFEGDLKAQYEKINNGLWHDLEMGSVSILELRTKRFEKLFELFGISEDPSLFDQTYMHNLSEVAILINQAYLTCQQLSKTYSMAVVTNGISFVQKNRLLHSGLSQFFDYIFVSEDVGYSKPASQFFDFVYRSIKATDKESVMIIGDSLSADMKGGHLFGIQTCWYNPSHLSNHSSFSVNYEIDELPQLHEILGSVKV